MTRRETTITRPDRDRLLEVTQARSNRFSWATFIDALQRQVSRARIVEPCRVPSDVVTMDSTVRFRDVVTGRREVYTLVYPDQADLAVGKLSVLSPLGIALLGARVGDLVTVARPTGSRRLRIESVPHQPEKTLRHRCGVAVSLSR